MSEVAGLWICMTGKKSTCGQSPKRRGPDSCLETTRPRIAPGSLVPTSPICRRKDNRDHRTKADIDQAKKRKKPSPRPTWRNSERGTRSGERGAGNAERGTRNAERGTRSGERGTRNAERGTRSGERGAGNAERGTRSGEREAGNAERGTRSGERGTRNAERGTRSGERGTRNADTDLRSPLFVFRSAFRVPRSAFPVVSHHRRSRRAVKNKPAVPMTIFASQHPSPSESFPSLPMLDPASSKG